MKIDLRKSLTSKLAVSILYRLIRTYSLTYRLQVINEDPWMRSLDNGERVLLCAWHQQFFSAIRHFRDYKNYHPALMISQSLDGEIIAGVAEKTGWCPVRGSSSKNGRGALQSMISKLKQTGLAGHIVDGPRGPAGVVKAGVIRIAQASDAVIVPFYVSADRAWYFRSWDRFFIPKPFAKVTLNFGEIIQFDFSGKSDDFEKQRIQLEQIMLPHLKQ
ncbi:MAG: lysophospholipid acyltransferase family protein [Deltaproteobacteria bacterium]|nr:lysophospholipid acyltransferase family protein [Deltaproteobacteria bacterium]